MRFDLEPRSTGQMDFLSNISKIMSDRDFICIVHISEIIYGLSFGAMTFDPEPTSKGQMDFLSNISKIMRDRDFVCIVHSHVGNHLWAFIWWHDL